MSTLSKEESQRYNRHLILQDFGLEKQLLLKAAKVLVVGAGGLGSPVLLYLAAAGVGTIGIADHDVVDLSNLQRQILFTVDDLGKSKATVAAARLKRSNPNVSLNVHQTKLMSANAIETVSGYDVVVDCTDNFPTRYLINDCCVLLQKPWVYGSILRYEGQVSVFNHRLEGSVSANYRDLFPTPPDVDSVPDCSQAGVIGVVAGIIGTLQANETIKIITKTGEVLTDQLLILDSATMQQTIIKVRNTHSATAIKHLIDYDEFCGINKTKTKSLEPNIEKAMKEVTVQELKAMKDSGADFQLIDVREPHEFDVCDLGGELIPQGEIPSNVDKVSKDKQVIIHCRSGARSGNIVQWLEKNHGYTNLYNLKGGILAWARDIDPSMPTY